MNPIPTPSAHQPPPLDPPLPDKMDLKSLFEALLRRPHAFAERLATPDSGIFWRCAGMALGSMLVFGVVLGCFAKHEQLWAAPVKVTCGLMFSALICFPSLYIFATLAGARMTLSQLAAGLAAALALAGLLLLGLAPAVWIFAESTGSLGFMGALAIGSWLIALGFALRFLKLAVTGSGGHHRGPLIIWSSIFLLVTLQMTTSLRPILGRSKTFLTQEKKFFLQHWGETAGESLEIAKPIANSTTDPSDTPGPPDGSRNPFLEK